MTPNARRRATLNLIHAFELDHQAAIEALGVDPYRTGRAPRDGLPNTPEMDLWDAGCEAGSFATRLRSILESMDQAAR